MAEPGAERGVDEDEQGSAREPSAFSSGARIGRYQLCFELASGGMAKVYLARVSGAAGFEKLVALKHVHSHLAERRDFVEMFMDEARIASRISHPNVCTVFDFGSAGRDHFIAMEYLAGETLGRIGRRVSRDPERFASPKWWATALRLVADASEGLHAAHELQNDAGELLQVVHRDVSPANIFVTYDGTVKVVDFGVARANERTHQTSAGQVKGHYAYMAPEHARGKTMDRRADIWSLGVVLFELLAGRRMMDQPNDAAILMSLLAGDLPSLSEVRPGLPDHVYAIVSRTLSMDPAGRPATARELARELERSIQKIGEPAGRSEVEDLMHTLFASERQRRLGLMVRARKMGTGQVVSAEDDSEQFGVHKPSTGPSSVDIASHVRRAPDGAIEIALPEGDAVEGEPPTTVTGPELAGSEAGSSTSTRKLAMVASLGVLGLVALVGLVWFASSRPVPAVSSVALGPPHTATPMLVASAPDLEGRAPVAAQVASDPVAASVVADTVPPDPLPEDPADAVPAAATDLSASDRASPTEAAPESSARRPARAHTARPRAPVGIGTVNIVTPGGWAEIYEGSRRIGRSPARIELPAGRHILDLRPFGTGARHRLSVTVTAGESTRVSEPVTP